MLDSSYEEFDEASARLEAAADLLLEEAEEAEADSRAVAEELERLRDEGGELDEWEEVMSAATAAAKRNEVRLRYSASRDVDDVAQEAILSLLERRAKIEKSGGRQIQNLAAFVTVASRNITTRTEDIHESSLDRKARAEFAAWETEFAQEHGRMPKSSESVEWREKYLASYADERRKPNRERLMRVSVRVGSIDAATAGLDGDIQRDYTAEESVFTSSNDGGYYDEGSYTARALEAEANKDKVLMRRYLYNCVAEQEGLPLVSDGFLAASRVTKSRSAISDNETLQAHVTRYQAAMDTEEESRALFAPWSDRELSAREMDDLCVLISNHPRGYELWDSAMRWAAKPRAGSTRAQSVA